MKTHPKFCTICGKEFLATNAWHRYCSMECKSRNARMKSPNYLPLRDGRFCRQCGNHFSSIEPYEQNRQHCSAECSAKSARESRSQYWDKLPVEKKQEYQKTTKQRIGIRGNMSRFLVRFPDAPKVCQSCGESRVLDIAHKPEHQRKGHWRTKGNTTLEKVWILCPTCHALLDRMHYSPQQLGLS